MLRNPLALLDPQMPTLQWLAPLRTMLPLRLSYLLRIHFRYLRLGPDAGTRLSAFHAGFPVLVLDYIPLLLHQQLLVMFVCLR
jgi:hypothetical protein